MKTTEEISQLVQAWFDARRPSQRPGNIERQGDELVVYFESKSQSFLSGHGGRYVFRIEGNKLVFLRVDGLWMS